tara:strand:- start:42514 stop:42957 length:444 start_codon:yes stop_codon:yes gene_type:complete
MKLFQTHLLKIAVLFALSFNVIAVSCQSGESNTSAGQQVAGSFSNVSVSDLNTAIASEKNILVLDVRTPQEVSQGYVANALNIDVNGATFTQQAKELDKTKTIYVYCRSGHRSQNASKQLVNMGFTDVRNVEGGFIAWSEKGYKSVK